MEKHDTMQSRDTNVVNVPSQNENPVIDMINDVFGMNKNEFVETMPNEVLRFSKIVTKSCMKDVKSIQSCLFY